MIEFYCDDICIGRAESSMVPVVGTGISIKKVTYHISGVSFSLDYSGQSHAVLRCNVELIKVKP